MPFGICRSCTTSWYVAAVARTPMQKPCFICGETSLVCEKHPDRPLSGKFGCGCGAPGTACLACSEAAMKNPRLVAEKLRATLLG